VCIFTAPLEYLPGAQLNSLILKDIVVESRANTSCFQHFYKICVVSLAIVELIFGIGCPVAIFGHVFEKKEEHIW
jgi:hypothetical protein